MKTIKYIIAMLCCTGLLGACTDEEKITSLSDDRQELLLSGSIEQLYTTRVNDGGFTDGDAIGVYVVDYLYEKDPGTLKTTGNRADNIFFSYNEGGNEWKGESEIYWKDKFTPIDIYSYYPYRKQVTDVAALPFVVQQNQSAVLKGQSKYGYELSDFLWAKAEKEYSGVKVVNLEHHHIMSKVKVDLYMGNGFTAEEWQKLEKSVTVHNVVSESVIDLSTGVVTAVKGSKPLSITPFKDKDCFHAIVVPQQLPASTDLLTIQVGKKTYTYQREALTTYEAGKNRTYTILVEKEVPKGDYAFKVMSESITPWQDDTFSHNGQAKEYIIVKNPQAGQLFSQFRTMKLDGTQVKNLKIEGEMNLDDFRAIQNEIPYLEAINLSEVKLKQCPYKELYKEPEDDAIPCEAFMEIGTLENVVFPKGLKKIGDFAFHHTLLSGSLEIPEGVEYVGKVAFSGIGYFGNVPTRTPNLTGELVLPSTLKYIGDYAFAEIPFSGHLSIPDGVEYIGDGAFQSCTNFSGGLHLPSSVKHIGPMAFLYLDGMYGDLILPENLTRIEEWSFSGHFSTVEWPKTLKYIGYQSFNGSLKGDIVLPPSLSIIEKYAFAYSDIQHIHFGDQVTSLGLRSFSSCDLRDTLYLPKNVEEIPKQCFANNSRLSAVVIPENVKSICDGAFAFDMSLVYVRCEGKIPPLMDDESFDFGTVSKMVVEVPADAVEAYRNAPGWSSFRITPYRNFICFPYKVKALNKGISRTLELQADAAWKVTHCPDWCHLSATEGGGKARLEMTMDALNSGLGNRSDSIVFTLSDSEANRFYVKVQQFDYQYQEDEIITLQKSTKGNGINILFVGDGYDAEDIAGGTYLKDMRQEMELFFDVEPYTTYRDYFNVQTIFARSNDHGVSGVTLHRDTKFDTTYGRKDGKRIDVDFSTAMNYISQHFPAIKLRESLAILVPNDTQYDGVTYMWADGSALAVCPRSEEAFPFDARGIIQHEAGGHGFGKLADEYIYHNTFIYTCQCPCCKHTDALLDGKSHGFYTNVSLDGSYETNEWKQLIFDPRYSDVVDLYEGGFFHGRGVYRPEWNSCMNNNVPYFNAPSRMEIVKRIKNYAGETFDFEEFVKLDAKARESATSRSGLGVLKEQQNMHIHHGPVLLEGSPLITK